jgi:DNA-binding response OmpR family regulator
VSQTQGGPTVLILDQDLGFVFWLGEIFHEAGCRVVPALDSEHAISITETFTLTIDVAVMNPTLPGVAAVLSALARRGRAAKVVAIRDEKIDAVGTTQADFVLKRPVGFEEVSKAHWLERIQEILRDVSGQRDWP